ncbi:nuclear transport factor 2 family protein [Aquimarina algiphila]|uniref:nuclear transport factor 2 family protein n=1 Tax=Aquimarina algiphila TaxID=2047982 RepID=UPI00232E6700|nr:nuclear transport factor 2 family protein [Aquimarina algiphila]
MKNLFCTIACIAFFGTTQAQSEEKLIADALTHYIEGTSYRRPEQISKAFYKDAKLYLNNKNDELWVVPSSEYISWYEKGEQNKFSGRTGRILNIDRENDIAVAKVEILIPERELRLTDLFLMKKLEGSWVIMSKSASKRTFDKNNADHILFIVSNAHFYGNSKLNTGNSFSEIVNAYHTFQKAGYTIDFVSPEGGAIPLAYINTSDQLQKEYLYNNDFMAALENTKKPAQIDAKNYKAVYYVGGGSAMYGVPENKNIQEIAMEIYEQHNGIISSVCHGTAGIVNLKTKDGKYLVQGKRVNGYPDGYENPNKEYYKQFPFFIQKTIEKRGGTFKFSPRNTPHIEVDGNLITGQNHLSSEIVAQKIIEVLSSRDIK